MEEFVADQDNRGEKTQLKVAKKVGSANKNQSICLYKICELQLVQLQLFF